MGVDSEEGGVKVGGRNISNLRYADDTILLAESSNDLKRLLMKVKEERAAFEHQQDKNRDYRRNTEL